LVSHPATHTSPLLPSPPQLQDFDTIFPGHGGFYDRFDCQLIMVMCTYVHYKTFVATSIVSMAYLMRQIGELSPTDQQTIYNQVGELMSKTQ
jgi:phosphatidate cytidylyltransferase